MGRSEPTIADCELDAVDERFLARLAHSGDTEAFDELMRRNLPSTYRLCAGMLGVGADAEDATQETFVRTWQSLPRFDTSRPFGPWLRGVAVKVCKQALRKRSGALKRETELTGREADTVAANAEETSDLADEVLEALSQLDDSYRLPLMLFYLEDASVAEVAEALGLSSGATRVRLHRGREMLKAMLEEQGSDEA